MLHYYEGNPTKLGEHLSLDFTSPMSWKEDIATTLFFDDEKNEEAYQRAWQSPACSTFYVPGDINAESLASSLQRILRPQSTSEDFETLGLAYFDKVPCAFMITYLKSDLSVWAAVKVINTPTIPIDRQIKVLSSVELTANEHFTKQPENLFFNDKCKKFVGNFLKGEQINPNGPLFLRLLASKNPIKDRLLEKFCTLTMRVKDLELELQGAELLKDLQAQEQCLYLLLEAQESLPELSDKHLDACITDTILFRTLLLLKQVNNPFFRKQMVVALFRTAPSLYPLQLSQRLVALIELVNLLKEHDLDSLSSLIPQLYLQDEGFDRVVAKLKNSTDSVYFLKDYFSTNSLLKKTLTTPAAQSHPELLEMIIFLHKQKLLPFLQDDKILCFANYYKLIENESDDFKQWCYFFWVKFPALDFIALRSSMKDRLSECPLLSMTLLKKYALGQKTTSLEAWIGTKKENYSLVIKDYFLQKEAVLEDFSELDLVQACNTFELLESLHWDKTNYPAVLRADAKGAALRYLLPTLKNESESTQKALVEVIFNTPEHAFSFSKMLKALNSVEETLKNSLLTRYSCITQMNALRWSPDDIFWISQPTCPKAEKFRAIFAEVDAQIPALFKNCDENEKLNFRCDFYPLILNVLNEKCTLEAGIKDLKILEKGMLTRLDTFERSKVKRFFVDIINVLAKIVTLGLIGSFQEKKTGHRELWKRTQEGVQAFKLFKEIEKKVKEKGEEENPTSYPTQPMGVM